VTPAFKIVPQCRNAESCGKLHLLVYFKVARVTIEVKCIHCICETLLNDIGFDRTALQYFKLNTFIYFIYLFIQRSTGLIIVSNTFAAKKMTTAARIKPLTNVRLTAADTEFVF
jgi:hypothetical protein